MSNNGSSHSLADMAEIESIVREYIQEQLKSKEIQWSSSRQALNCRINGATTAAIRSPRLRLNVNKRVKVRESLCSLSSDLLSSFEPNLVDMCQRLALPSPSEPAYESSNNAEWSAVGYRSYQAVAQELFSEGIKWAHIVTLFAFSFELAFLYGISKGHLAVVDDVVDWLSVYVNNHLIHWINDHGGWEGLISYASGDEPDGGPLRRESWSFRRFILVSGSLGALAAVTLAGLLFISKKLSQS